MVKYFICSICQAEIKNDLEHIHGHQRSTHSERIIDQYTISEINNTKNWIEKEV